MNSSKDWENAELGDDGRKQKFLRLMGAKKAEHQQEQSTVQSDIHEKPVIEKEQEEPLSVKSANEWENANLGDTSRRNKFLRLMGASKKEHSGKFVIGDKNEQNTRKVRSEDELTKGLESQYNQGLELRMSGAARRHKGLGFQDDLPIVPESTPKETKEADKQGGTSEQKTETEENRDLQSQRDRETREHDRHNLRSESTHDHRSDRRHYRDGDRHRDRSFDRQRDNYRNEDRNKYNSNREHSYQSHQFQQHPVPGQGGHVQLQVGGGFNQTSSYQNASYGGQYTNTSNRGQYGYQGSYQQSGGTSQIPLPLSANQPPPPPPPLPNEQTPAKPVNYYPAVSANQPQMYNTYQQGQNLQHSNDTNSAISQKPYQLPPSQVIQQQPVNSSRTPNEQPAAHSSTYFKKPAMTFVKSSDS